MKKNMEAKTRIDNKTVIKSFNFQLVQQVFTQLASFIIQILLARMLFPEDYGIMSIILVFINFANVFTTSGYGKALIQKSKIDDLDISSITIFSLFISVVLSLLFWAIAPIVSNVYSNADLTILLRSAIILLPLSRIN